MQRRSKVVLLSLILLLAIGLRLWGIDNGLPSAQVTDETEDISASLRIASGGAPSYYYIRVGWNLTEWAVLGPYYLYLKVTHPGFSTGDFERLYFTQRGTFILLVRLLTVAITTFSVLLAYFAGKALSDSERGGFIAAFLMAIHPSGVYLSHYALSDNLAVLGVTLGLLGAIYMAKTGRRWAYIVAGIGVTLAMLGHIQAFTIVVPVILAHVIYWWRRMGRPRLLLLTRWLYAAGGFVVSHIVLNPYIILKPTAVLADLNSIYGQRFQTSFDLAMRLSTVVHNVPLPIISTRPYFIVLALIGIGFAIYHRNAEALIVGLFLIIFCALILPAPEPRITFWLQAFLPGVLLSAYAIALLTRANGHALRLSAIVLVGIVTALAFTECLLMDHALSNENTRNLAYDYIAQNIPTGTSIIAGDPFVYGVPLGRTDDSLQRLQQKGPLPPVYAFQLTHPGSLVQAPYNLFGPEFQRDIVSDDTFWTFVQANHIQYVVEADYCAGQARYNSSSALEFPAISPAVRPKLTLLTAFSPFHSDSCEQIIENRTAMEYMGNLPGWLRVGPIVRIYVVNP